MAHAMQLAALLPIRPVTFLGQVMISAAKALAGQWQFRLKDLSRVAADCSGRAVPIVTVVNVLVGAILAFVGAVQLVKFGAGIYVADLVGNRGRARDGGDHHRCRDRGAHRRGVRGRDRNHAIQRRSRRARSARPERGRLSCAATRGGAAVHDAAAIRLRLRHRPDRWHGGGIGDAAHRAGPPISIALCSRSTGRTSGSGSPSPSSSAR